jgi:hypothetical protein
MILSTYNRLVNGSAMNWEIAIKCCYGFGLIFLKEANSSYIFYNYCDNYFLLVSIKYLRC